MDGSATVWLVILSHGTPNPWSSGAGPGEVVAMDAALVGAEVWVTVNNPPNNVVRLDTAGTVLGYLTVSPYAIRIAQVDGNAWIDDSRGTRHVFAPDGTALATFAIPSSSGQTGGGIVQVGSTAWCGADGGFYPAPAQIAVFAFDGTVLQTSTGTNGALSGAMVFVPGA